MTVPARNTLCSYTQFDGATLDLMAVAYDATVKRLDLKSDTPPTGKLAAKIASLAAEGERDVGRLTEFALVAIK